MKWFKDKYGVINVLMPWLEQTRSFLTMSNLFDTHVVGLMGISNLKNFLNVYEGRKYGLTTDEKELKKLFWVDKDAQISLRPNALLELMPTGKVTLLHCPCFQ